MQGSVFSPAAPPVPPTAASNADLGRASYTVSPETTYYGPSTILVARAPKTRSTYQQVLRQFDTFGGATVPVGVGHLPHHGLAVEGLLRNVPFASGYRGREAEQRARTATTTPSPFNELERKAREAKERARTVASPFNDMGHMQTQATVVETLAIEAAIDFPAFAEKRAPWPQVYIDWFHVAVSDHNALVHRRNAGYADHEHVSSDVLDCFKEISENAPFVFYADSGLHRMRYFTDPDAISRYASRADEGPMDRPEMHYSFWVDVAFGRNATKFWHADEDTVFDYFVGLLSTAPNFSDIRSFLQDAGMLDTFSPAPVHRAYRTQVLLHLTQREKWKADTAHEYDDFTRRVYIGNPEHEFIALTDTTRNEFFVNLKREWNTFPRTWPATGETTLAAQRRARVDHLSRRLAELQQQPQRQPATRSAMKRNIYALWPGLQ